MFKFHAELLVRCHRAVAFRCSAIVVVFVDMHDAWLCVNVSIVWHRCVASLHVCMIRGFLLSSRLSGMAVLLACMCCLVYCVQFVVLFGDELFEHAWARHKLRCVAGNWLGAAAKSGDSGAMV